MNRELIEAMARFKAKYEFANEEKTAKHCKIRDCHCTHMDCDRGWIEHTIEGTTYVDACKQCRPMLRWGLQNYNQDSETRQDALVRRAAKLTEKGANLRDSL
jgi:hypothetical protein